MSSELEFNEKIEKIESSALEESMEEISPLINATELEDISNTPDPVSFEGAEMSTCTCTGGCGSNYSYGGCTCTGSCGSNYHK